MTVFDLKPSREIGLIKEHIKEAILDGTIPNEYDAAYQLMLKEGKRLGLKANTEEWSRLLEPIRSMQISYLW